MKPVTPPPRFPPQNFPIINMVVVFTGEPYIVIRQHVNPTAPIFTIRNKTNKSENLINHPMSYNLPVKIFLVVLSPDHSPPSRLTFFKGENPRADGGTFVALLRDFLVKRCHKDWRRQQGARRSERLTGGRRSQILHPTPTRLPRDLVCTFFTSRCSSSSIAESELVHSVLSWSLGCWCWWTSSRYPPSMNVSPPPAAGEGKVEVWTL